MNGVTNDYHPRRTTRTVRATDRRATTCCGVGIVCRCEGEMTTVIDIHTVNGVRPEYDIYIGRQNPWQGFKRSKWANPYKVGKDGTLEEVLLKYKRHVLSDYKLMRALPELKGKRLGCWCKNKHACHGDVLAELIAEFVK